jgi:hypothetical protein
MNPAGLETPFRHPPEICDLRYINFRLVRINRQSVGVVSTPVLTPSAGVTTDTNSDANSDTP